MELVYRHERPLFIISIIISILVWLVVVIATFGVILVFILLGFLSYLFMQSAFISFIKGTAVKITEEQLPDLYKQYLSCCDKLGIKSEPDIYMLHGDGIFNAFATRFLGRNFVILLSDVVDALEDEKGCLNFYMGHELGHIHRKHLIWKSILIPSRILPLLGSTYSRAREITCDNYGFTCCEDPHEAIRGLAIFAAGGKRWKTLAINRYTSQASDTSSFWMSFHELTSGYPWLVKRMARLEAKAKEEEAIFPRRNFFAWLLACFVPPIPASFGGGNPIMMIAVIGIIAAIAIPQFAAYRNRSFQVAIQHEVSKLAEAQHTYYTSYNTFADDINKLKFLFESDEISLNIVQVDSNCFIIQGSHIKYPMALLMDCNGRVQWTKKNE